MLRIFQETIISAALILLITVGCATTDRNFTPDSTGILKAQPIDPLYLKDVKWTYIQDEEDWESFVEKNGYGMFLLTRNDFQNLNKNMLSILRFIRDQQDSIGYYENVIKEIDRLPQDQ